MKPRLAHAIMHRAGFPRKGERASGCSSWRSHPLSWGSSDPWAELTMADGWLMAEERPAGLRLHPSMVCEAYSAAEVYTAISSVRPSLYIPFRLFGAIERFPFLVSSAI